ncbi:hypothetical protein B0H10DRAFT_1938188 [Mycena sp. CBHHK59/15]|nr:hypothetical protein B0H10DRAFT_1938188 [Mycena sp. CBHHK59/15]
MDPAQYPQHEINSSQHQPYPGLDIDAVLSSEIENGRLREELARLQAFQHVAMEPDIEMGETAGKHINNALDLVHVRVRPAPHQGPLDCPKSASPAARITVPVPGTDDFNSASLIRRSSRSKSTPQVLCLVVVRKHSI